MKHGIPTSQPSFILSPSSRSINNVTWGQPVKHPFITNRHLASTLYFFFFTLYFLILVLMLVNSIIENHLLLWRVFVVYLLPGRLHQKRSSTTSLRLKEEAPASPSVPKGEILLKPFPEYLLWDICKIMEYYLSIKTAYFLPLMHSMHYMHIHTHSIYYMAHNNYIYKL